MTTYSSRITTGTNDAHDSNDAFPGSQNTAANVFMGATGVGETMHSGFIHEDVNITSGSTINSATLTVYRIGFDSDGSEQLTVYMLEDGTPTTFGTTTNSPYDQYTAGPVTTATASWTMGADGGDLDPEVSPSLVTVLQEVVDTVGDVTDLETLVLGTVNANATVYALENAASGNSALLDIDFTEGGAPAAAPVRRDLGLLGVGR